jgi:hypothetical protein
MIALKNLGHSTSHSETEEDEEEEEEENSTDYSIVHIDFDNGKDDSKS